MKNYIINLIEGTNFHLGKAPYKVFSYFAFKEVELSYLLKISLCHYLLPKQCMIAGGKESICNGKT